MPNFWQIIGSSSGGAAFLFNIIQIIIRLNINRQRPIFVAYRSSHRLQGSLEFFDLFE